MRSRSTSNAVFKTAYHLCWATKRRRAALDTAMQSTLKAELGAICRDARWDLYAVEAMPDHVHVFVGLPPRISIAQAAHRLKGRSSRVLRQAFPSLRRYPRGGHLWNPAYYVGTAGSASAKAVVRYIEEQKTR